MRLVLPLLFLLLVLAADFVLAWQLGVYQSVPWPHLLGAGAVLVWLALECRRAFDSGKKSRKKKGFQAIAALLVALALTLGYAWYSFAYSAYDSHRSRAVGTTVTELLGLGLENQRGELTSVLEPAAKERATLVVLYRGYWCPYCRQELIQLQGAIDEFRSRDVRVVASSVDSPEDLRRMRQSSGASFEFLSDPEGRLLDLFGVRHEQGRFDGADIAQSASFLVSAEGEVLWGKVAENYRVRPRPAEILERIDALDPG